jgi:hypothetical protein
MFKPFHTISSNVSKTNEVRQDTPAEQVADNHSSTSATPSMQAKAMSNSSAKEVTSKGSASESVHSEPHTIDRQQSRTQRRLQAAAARLVDDILTDENGPMGRKELIAYSQSDFSSSELKAIPRTWPPELTSANDIKSWANNIVSAHQEVFSQKGELAYVNGIAKAIFQQGPNKSENFPRNLKASCLALDKQVIQKCRGQGLSKEEVDAVRMRVLGGFLDGRVLGVHLRPMALRERSYSEAGYELDAEIRTAVYEDANIYLSALIDINDALELKSNASITSKLYDEATDTRSSSVKDRRFLIKLIFAFNHMLPSNEAERKGARWVQAEQFIFDQRYAIDDLSPNGKQYFLQQIKDIAASGSGHTLSKAALKPILKLAKAMV